MEANPADCASLMMNQKLFPSKPHYASRISSPIRTNTPSTESEVEYMPPDIDFEVPISSQLEATPPIVVHMENAPDNDTDTPPVVRPENTPQDDHDTTIHTDSFPVIQDTSVNPSPGTEADDTGENSENIMIIEGLRKEVKEMHLQMENVQNDYANLVSSKDEASATIRQLNRDIVTANLKIERRDQDLKSMDTQYMKAQAKIDTLENMLKATLEKPSFTSSSWKLSLGRCKPSFSNWTPPLITPLSNWMLRSGTQLRLSQISLSPSNILLLLLLQPLNHLHIKPAVLRNSEKCSKNSLLPHLYFGDVYSLFRPFADIRGMSVIGAILLVVWSSSVIGVLSAEINLAQNPMSLSLFHDQCGITACVSSVVIGIFVPLAAIGKSSSFPDVCKTTAQVVVGCLTIVSIIWAARLALEALLQSLRSEGRFQGTQI